MKTALDQLEIYQDLFTVQVVATHILLRMHVGYRFMVYGV